MSLRKGLVRAGRTLDSPRKSLGGGVVRSLNLSSPAGWLTGEEDISMSQDKAMKVSTVNRCVEVLSTSMAVLPVYIMNERTKERLSDHRLGRVLWGRANEAMTTFDYQRLMLCNQLLRGNAYAWIFRDPNSGHPLELIPLPPDYVRLQVDLDGHLWYLFTHPGTGELTALRPDDVLHYKAYSEDGLSDWAEGSFAFGLNAAPYEGFPALLHQGERVLPPSGGGDGGGVSVTIHVDELNVRRESDVDAIAETLAQKLRNAMLRGGG